MRVPGEGRRRNRSENGVQRVSTNGRDLAPSTNGHNGRGLAGRFAKGNPGGPGNPHGARVAALRAVLLDTVTDADLRASRQTELTDEFPAHVVADWLGNTAEVADRHYLQTTDAHFQRAAAGPTGAGVVQQPAGTEGNRPQMQNAPPSEGEALQPVAAGGGIVNNGALPPRGVEPRFSD